jgi:hypothetical protein
MASCSVAVTAFPSMLLLDATWSARNGRHLILMQRHDQLHSTLRTFAASISSLELITLRHASCCARWLVGTRAVPSTVQEGFSHAAHISRLTAYYCCSTLMENLGHFPASVFESPQIPRLKSTDYASANGTRRDSP